MKPIRSNRQVSLDLVIIKWRLGQRIVAASVLPSTFSATAIVTFASISTSAVASPYIQPVGTRLVPTSVQENYETDLSKSVALASFVNKFSDHDFARNTVFMKIIMRRLAKEQRSLSWTVETVMITTKANPVVVKISIIVA